jgi:hypothetical protein
MKKKCVVFLKNVRCCPKHQCSSKAGNNWIKVGCPATIVHVIPDKLDMTITADVSLNSAELLLLLSDCSGSLVSCFFFCSSSWNLTTFPSPPNLVTFFVHTPALREGLYKLMDWWWVTTV